MQPVDFYRLSRVIQERFVGSVNGAGLPAPILRAPWKPREPLLWFGGTVASALALVLSYRAGYGNLSSHLAIQGIAWMGVYVGIITFGVFGVLRAFAVLRDHQRSPFRRGIYVFPVGLIDARTPTLRVYPIEDLGNVVAPVGAARAFTLEFGSKSFAFPVKDSAQAENARTALDTARGKVGEAGAARESVRPKALAALDPLQGYANPLVSSEPMTRAAPPWAKFGWAFALVTGLVLGVSLWAVRNAKSDDAMYERAASANDSASLRAYLDKASRHRTDVAAYLLPRAELHEAQKAGSVTAIEQFIKDHPQTGIGPEMALALKTSLATELNVAISAGTLAALDDFSRKHPQSHLDAELKTARHAVYQAAFDKYAALAPTKSASEAVFVKSLLGWAELKGPPVEIRFKRGVSKTMDKADGAVQKHKLFKGVVSLPSRYFDAAHDKPFEDAAANAIIQRFAGVFPTEILALAVGEPIADPEAPLPTVIAVPTLFIEHTTAWSNSVVASHAPSGVYAGLELSFLGTFRLPDDTKPVHVKADAWHAPNVASAKESDKPEDLIYGKMHDEAWDQFQRRLLGSFFASNKTNK